MEFWCETHLGVGQLGDTSLIVEVPSDDWTWCANPIEHRRLPQGFARRVAGIIGHFKRKASAAAESRQVASTREMRPAIKPAVIAEYRRSRAQP